MNYRWCVPRVLIAAAMKKKIPTFVIPAQEWIAWLTNGLCSTKSHLHKVPAAFNPSAIELRCNSAHCNSAQ